MPLIILATSGKAGAVQALGTSHVFEGANVVVSEGGERVALGALLLGLKLSARPDRIDAFPE